jgi:hypothetical protein
MQAIHRTVLFCLVTVLYALDSFLCYLDPKLSGLLIRKIGELEMQYLTQVDAEIWQMLRPREGEE